MMGTDTKHAVFAPSRMKMLINCPGSYALTKDLPEQAQSDFAAEGTLAHDYIEQLLKTKDKKAADKILKSIPDDEMRGHVSDYLAFIDKVKSTFLKTATGKWFEFIEQKVELTEEVYGTLDYALVADRGGAVSAIVCDFKYGRGVEVSPEQNEQLLTYAAALNRHFKGRIKKFYIIVYQPRTPGDAYGRWDTGYESVEAHEAKVLVTVSKAKMMAEGSLELALSAGDHCRFCRAKSTCPAVHEEVNKTALALLDDESKPPAVNTIPVEQLVNIFSKKKQIESFLEDVEHHLLTMLRDGTPVPGYKLVNGRSQRKWLEDVDAVAKKLKELGVKKPLKKSLIGIGDVERQIGEGKIDDLVTRTEPKLQIAPESDKRAKAITSEDAATLLTEL